MLGGYGRTSLIGWPILVGPGLVAFFLVPVIWVILFLGVLMSKTVISGGLFTKFTPRSQVWGESNLFQETGIGQVKRELTRREERRERERDRVKFFLFLTLRLFPPPLFQVVNQLHQKVPA